MKTLGDELLRGKERKELKGKLLLEATKVKQKMDDIKEEIKVYTHPYDFRDIMIRKLTYGEIIEIINKHLGDKLK